MKTQRQRVRRNQMYQFVCAYYDANHQAPSYRDIMRALGYRSMCGVSNQLRHLEADGLLTLRPGQARGIIINDFDRTPDHELRRLARLVVERWEDGALGPAIRDLAAYLDGLDERRASLVTS